MWRAIAMELAGRFPQGNDPAVQCFNPSLESQSCPREEAVIRQRRLPCKCHPSRIFSFLDG